MEQESQKALQAAKQKRLFFVMLLTFARFPLVLIFVGFAIKHAYDPSTITFSIAFTALIASAVTDLFDGYFARRFHVETSLGAHADPLMDKFFYIAALPLLVFVSLSNGNHAHSVAILIITILFLSRDLWVTFLRSIGSIYNISGCANWWGKVRTAVNFPLICCIYHFEEAPRQLLNPTLLYTTEIIAILITIISIYVYTRHYWQYLLMAAEIKQDTSAKTPDDPQ